MADTLRNIGAQMANVMFNLAQRPGEPITGDIAATMDSLRKQWDAALASRPAEVDDEGLRSNSPEIEGITQPPGNPGELPAVLFDGHAVYSEIARKLGKAHCHSHETVSATLDAVVRLMRAAPSHTTKKDGA